MMMFWFDDDSEIGKDSIVDGLSRVFDRVWGAVR